MRREFHNLLSDRFVRDIIGPAIKNGTAYADLMVVFESAQTAMLEVLNLHYKMEPAVAVGLVEASLHRAIERFAELRKGNGR